MYEYKARVINVVDGDTLDLDIDLGYCVHVNARVHLRGVDTPEVRGVERPQGLSVKEVVKEELLGKEVIISSYKADAKVKTNKYGRWLVDVYLENENYNESLVRRGLGFV